MSDDNTWLFEPSLKRISHPNGLCLEIDGPLQNPEAVLPIHIPENIAAMELVALIREGVNYCKALAMDPREMGLNTDEHLADVQMDKLLTSRLSSSSFMNKTAP